MRLRPSVPWPGGAIAETGASWPRAAPRAVVYALSLAVYCMSWTWDRSGSLRDKALTFCRSHGPILVIDLGAPVRTHRTLARSQNLTDFVSGPVWKSQAVAACLPHHLRLRLLRAVSTTMLTVVDLLRRTSPRSLFSLAIALGARRLRDRRRFGSAGSGKEHQDRHRRRVGRQARGLAARRVRPGGLGCRRWPTDAAHSQPNPAVWHDAAVGVRDYPPAARGGRNRDRRGLRTAFPAYSAINLFVAVGPGLKLMGRSNRI